MKSRFLSSLCAAMIVIAFFACSKKDEPTPDPDKNPEEETNPGTNTDDFVSYDKSYPVPLGKANFAAMQPDGKVVIAGLSKSTTAVIFRIDKEGAIDPSFSIDQDKSWIIKSVQGIAVQADGKIVLGGEFVISGKTYTVIRLTSTGGLDNSFSPYLFVQPSYFTVSMTQLKTLSDGKIIMAMHVVYPSQGYVGNAIQCLNSNGSASFTIETTAFMNANNVTLSSNRISDMIELPDGKLLVSGGLFFGKRRYLARLNRDGSLDETFEFKERMDIDASKSGAPLSLALQDGKIVVGGSFTDLVDESQRDTKYPYLNLMRLNSNGSVDQSFSGNKEPVMPFGLNVRTDKSLVGLANAYSENGTQIIVYNSNGSLKAAYKIADISSSLGSLFKLTDNQYLVTGNIIYNNESHAIARLNIK